MKTKANSAREMAAKKKWARPAMRELTVRNTGGTGLDFGSFSAGSV